MTSNCKQICMLVQFHEVTQCIAKRFRLVNARIRQELIIQIYRQSERRHYPQYVTHSRDGASSNKIKSFMNAYQTLLDAVNQANAFYCDLLMSSIFYKFVHVTISLYTFFLFLMPINLLGLITSGTMSLCHICYLLLVVSSITDVTQAADQATPMICKLINQDLDDGLKRQLESFLQQLAVKQFEFSARGYFKISRQLLITMATTVATYLVVLIQFHTQSKDGN
ncbi:gustatory receptor for sugar taste 43a-like [Homalodisca vitripennis]|uniref:gustatory receptor for sugar taste 43a-like n=1 Tax=Homalodisca vitripennis TaxID=197043 RepID=UPI001EEA8975|nr:gustatory receptor for sugar taste 43a-like [Homalodisca vitripennis]